MKVKDLLKLLEGVDPESVVLVREGGAISPTDNFDEHDDYNSDREILGQLEFFILVSEEWE